MSTCVAGAKINIFNTRLGATRAPAARWRSLRASGHSERSAPRHLAPRNRVRVGGCDARGCLPAACPAV